MAVLIDTQNEKTAVEAFAAVCGSLVKLIDAFCKGVERGNT